MLWGQQRTYDGICSRRFGNTLADMLIYTIQQIAETVSYSQNTSGTPNDKV